MAAAVERARKRNEEKRRAEQSAEQVQKELREAAERRAEAPRRAGDFLLNLEEGETKTFAGVQVRKIRAHGVNSHDRYIEVQRPEKPKALLSLTEARQLLAIEYEKKLLLDNQ